MINSVDKLNTYFTSDWHIGHANSIAFDSRPFVDLERMHKVLINNYNAVVRSQDTCYFLGDMGLCKGDTIRDVVSQLNGTKIFILGNHDKTATAMKRMGFSVVLNSASIIVCGQIVTMTHCPLRGIFREDVTNMRGSKPGEMWHGETRHIDFSIPDFGQFHLHGHLHSKPANRILDRQWDVGVVGNGYKPVSLSAIESWIVRTRK